MAGSTISTTITHGVTLGGGTYASPLTINATGAIVPAGGAATGLYAALAGGYVLNAGGILAGAGTSAASAGGVGSVGGMAVDLLAGSLSNTGSIVGGSGGTGGAATLGGAGGVGGYGVAIAGGSLTNHGTIAGGAGGTGGAATYVYGVTYTGGVGGIGGAGLHISAGTLVNDAMLVGGTGGTGGAGGQYHFTDPGGVGGAGGAGADLTTGILINNGTVLGGSGGTGGVSNFYYGLTPITAASGSGGIGVQFHAGGTLVNVGLIGHGSGVGTAADAVYFGTGASRLVLAPQASFNGLVVANSSFANLLELTTGSGVGTLVGLGSQYRGFSSLIVDGGATWGLAAATNSFAATGSVLVYGTLTSAGTLVGGATILVDGSLTNTGTIAGLANRQVTVNGGMTNAGVLVGASGASLTVLGSLSNTGLIANTSSVGIVVAGGLSNAATGTITGGSGTAGAYGKYMGGIGGAGPGAVTLSSGSMTNTGTLIGGTGGVGGYAGYPAGVGGPGTGGTGGTGGAGVTVVTGAVTNLGTIIGGAGGPGGPAFGGAAFTGSQGTAGTGVSFASGGTLTNGGLISGGVDAVYFGTGASRLIVDPGATFAGSVVADGLVTNVLELASAASAGSIAGLGTTVIGFDTIAFDANALWSITGSSAGIASGETITGFALGDTIELIGFVASTDTFTGAGLVLGGTGGPKTIGIEGTFTTASFNVTTTASDTIIQLRPPCFGKGTLIATEHGDVPVEALRVGDRVRAMRPDRSLLRPPSPTASQSGEGWMSGAEPIIWIGHRTINCTWHPQPHKVWPVRVSANAFGPGQPRRDLYLSADHAILIDDVLIPVKCLINYKTIVQVPVGAITYYHVELSHHAVLLAEGLPAESYLDTGDRQSFETPSVVSPHPDFAAQMWEARGCAPLVVSGPKLAAARDRCGQPSHHVRAQETQARASRSTFSFPA